MQLLIIELNFVIIITFSISYYNSIKNIPLVIFTVNLTNSFIKIACTYNEHNAVCYNSWFSLFNVWTVNWVPAISSNKVMAFQNKCLCVCNRCRCRSVPNTNLQANLPAFTFPYPLYLNPQLNPIYPSSITPQVSTIAECENRVAVVDEVTPACSRRPRTIFTTEQLLVLESRFSVHTHLSHYDAADLGKELGLDVYQVQTWFRNRRAKLRNSMKRNFCRGRNVKITRVKNDGTETQNAATVDEDNDVTD